VELYPGLREAYGAIPRAPIRLICNPLVKDVNQGGMLRIAEAFRIEKVTFSPEEDRAEDFSGHRGSTIWQPYEFVPVEEAVPQALAGGFQLAALTLSDHAIPLEKVSWKFPLALVIGEERYGVPPDIEEQCHFSVAIPIYGIMQSLNVTTATAIALHAATNEYARQNRDFQPVRRASRNLLDLPEVRYAEPPESSD
jgi:tRNA (guanosine-2'-O-)-methyltransferase